VASAPGPEGAWFEKRIVVPPVASAPVPEDVWNLITQALKRMENRIIGFD
jgi:hypothetical protein